MGWRWSTDLAGYTPALLALLLENISAGRVGKVAREVGLGVGTVHRLKAKERIRRLMRNAAPWPKDAQLT